MEQEISRDMWTQFFDDWSRKNMGQAATLHASGPDIGDEDAAKGTINGITADLKDGENGITVLFEGDEHVSYAIADPTKVTEMGSGLSFETGDGSTYTLKMG